MKGNEGEGEEGKSEGNGRKVEERRGRLRWSPRGARAKRMMQMCELYLGDVAVALPAVEEDARDAGEYGANDDTRNDRIGPVGVVVRHKTIQRMSCDCKL